MTHRAKGRLLVVLWAVWTVVLVWRAVMLPDPVRIPLKFVSDQRLRKDEPPADDGASKAHAWQASQGSHSSLSASKNIFAPLPKPRAAQRGTGAAGRSQSPTRARRRGVHPAQGPPAVVSVPTPALLSSPAPSPDETAALQAGRQRELATQQARQLMGQYRYLGYLTRYGEPCAFLGKGRELYIVRVGEILEAGIHVAAIDGSALTLRDAVSAAERSLTLAPDDSRPPGL